MTCALQLAWHCWGRRRGVQAIARKKQRKARDRALQKADFLALFAALDPIAHSYFTDGSSFGNLGPAGAGFVCEQAGVYASEDIGVNTNNVAEVKALSNAIDHAITTSNNLPTEQRPPIHFFIDNQYAINVVSGKWKAKSNRPMFREGISKLRALQALTPARLFWVPGHSEVVGNEICDWLAKRGASETTSIDPPPAEISSKSNPANQSSLQSPS